MQTEIIGEELATPRAVEELRADGVVALPTETVYGLAGAALVPTAVAKIFQAKDRPKFNPLIVHLPDIGWLEKVAHVDPETKEIVDGLTRAFWPGPFTIVLPKTDLVPDLVTAGLNTVAVRMSAHPVFQKVIRAFGRPLAAPSANRFGRISPTIAQDVESELGGRIPLIVDGGRTTHGIESTVVAVPAGYIEILRPGPITDEALRGMGFQPMNRQGADVTAGPLRSPGMLPTHYSPATPLRVVDRAGSFQSDSVQKLGLLAWRPVEKPERFACIRYLTETGDLREAAANLFRALRELDDAGLDLIVAERVPNEGLGGAINDRLNRAAGSRG